MQSTILLALICFTSAGQLIAAPAGEQLGKVFNYEGALPVRDEYTGELTKVESNETETTSAEQAEAEAACWKLINDESAVTFALQRKVLDELDSDLKNLTIDDQTRRTIESVTSEMRKNMNLAEEGLKHDSADEYFDALFDTSEDIVRLASLLRTPKLDDELFLVLVKAVSRLGRNNAALIQEFTQMCSFKQRFSLPRSGNVGLL